MQQYRIYTFLTGNKVAGPATEIECSSDEEWRSNWWTFAGDQVDF